MAALTSCNPLSNGVFLGRLDFRGNISNPFWTNSERQEYFRHLENSKQKKNSVSMQINIFELTKYSEQYKYSEH